MGKIRILPDILVSKISAGEVVERPASVVKELIENSIDASADKITIFLKSGGKRQIKVIDNGYGMTRDDALMSLERHATSKIKDVNDLFSLDTLGFRGEAIPSVASVSRLNIITKTDEQQSGVEINSEGGVIKKVKEVACNTGTSIEVNNLFFNTPARLKFLKKPQTELMRVMEIIQREAISMPRIQFEVFSEDKNLYHYKSTTDIKSRITEIIPNTELYEFESENKGVEINGYLSSPLESRTSLQKLYTYVNNRSVRDRFINRLVMDSYGNLLDKGRFPQGVIFIIVDHKDVDVNVHPTKIEVKFKNQYFVGECIK
ncbi:MAG: DNA mismatch repair endonuclease MutL, partial [Candidatus Dadabacteria bacterium]|nr:DNA mismatch repair endonuclease MutL [Candidatus Dadabacteria bacterium]NIQ13435.1 DNA mismatch repair endonuclease MutL [Candidatus Dadabacteria bacterium]